MVLLEHPRAGLRVDEVDLRPNVCDGSDFVHVRLHEPYRVEHVEHLPQARERCRRTSHLSEPGRAQVAQPEIVYKQGFNAPIVSGYNGIKIGTGNLRVRHPGTL